MKLNSNAGQHFSSANDRSRGRPSRRYRCTETFAEPAGISIRDEASQCDKEDSSVLAHSKGSENAINLAFANFLLGIRVNDQPRQNEAYAVLIRMARSVAQKVGGYILHSGDWEEVAINCIHQELRKHQKLTAHEIVQYYEAKKFAYLWKALKSDFIDEIRKLQRREKTKERTAVLSGPESRLDKYWDKRDYESTAEEYQCAAQHLPIGPAAIAEALAELYRNPEQLLELTAPELSGRASKTLFVEHVAKSRGVGAQVVRKDIRKFEEYSDDPEYARLRNILRRDINVPAWDTPKTTAPTAPALQASPLLAVAQPALADGDKGSKTWGPKCVICDTRLHNEGDFCSVCVPEDTERMFQGFVV